MTGRAAIGGFATSAPASRFCADATVANPGSEKTADLERGKSPRSKQRSQMSSPIARSCRQQLIELRRRVDTVDDGGDLPSLRSPKPWPARTMGNQLAGEHNGGHRVIAFCGTTICGNPIPYVAPTRSPRGSGL